MKRVPGLLAAAALLSLAFATVAFAQQPPTAEGVVIKQRIIQGPEGAPPPPDANFVFMASEIFGGKTVKGVPYSAETFTETIQTLADGNRIVRRTTSLVYRDSAGRTRREQSFKNLEIFGGGSEEPTQTVFINDPVAGVSYMLDSRSRTARKSVPLTFEFTKTGETIQGFRFEDKVPPGMPGGPSGNVVMPAPMGAPGGMRLVTPEGGPEGAGTFVFKTKRDHGTAVNEQLGKQTVEGVEAEGVRTAVTIPAGEIGNERAIEIVSERWYSPELQLIIMTRHSDPRFGDSTYKLTNISRVEPAKSLFEVPADYTLKEGPLFGPATAPLRTRRPGHPE
jgi:hypothetical protein